MIPSAAVVHNAIVDRIRSSGLTIQVVYPTLRSVAVGGAGVAAPISPLTGTLAASGVVDATPTTQKPPVTVPCLWSDAYHHAFSDLGENEKKTNRLGWVEGAHALVSVAVADVAVDPMLPLGDTVFTGCDHIVYQNIPYKVLTARPLGAGFALPVV